MPISRTGFIGGIGGTVTVSEGVIVRDFGEVSVPTATETTLATFTVPTAKYIRIAGVYGEGVVDGIFRIYIDSTKIWQSRNAWTERNVQSAIQYDAAASEVVTLKVIHQNGVNQTFSGSIWGYENDV